MALTYYKATRPDGFDFRTSSVDYAGHLASGEILTHPSPRKRRDTPSTYFSVSVEPAETLIGGEWPCRLFRVEPVGRTITSDMHRYKRGTSALCVVEELPAWQALGPNGREVAAIVERCKTLTAAEARSLGAAGRAARDAAGAWDAAGARDAACTRDAALEAARRAARGAAWRAAWAAAGGAAWGAARYAALAWLVLDKLTEGQFQALAGPWLSVIGEPDVSVVK